MNILSIAVSLVDFSLVTLFIQIILKATPFCFHSNGNAVYAAVCGAVPGSRKFCVDKVWGVAATVGHEGNFFVPAARVISSSLNYASAEVSGSVRIRQVQSGRIEESCHTKLIKPCSRSSQSCHIGRPGTRSSVEQQSNRYKFILHLLREENLNRCACVSG